MLAAVAGKARTEKSIGNNAAVLNTDSWQEERIKANASSGSIDPNISLGPTVDEKDCFGKPLPSTRKSAWRLSGIWLHQYL